jgi:chromosome segregation ATPase
MDEALFHSQFQGHFQSQAEDLSFQDEEVLSETSVTPTEVTLADSSVALETLIRQNQDLTAQLTVALRRLHSNEQAAKKISLAMRQSQTEVVKLQDLNLVLREKEKLANTRAQQLDAELAKVKSRFPDLEKMEDKILRMERYQERVRTHVKPYIQQLKNYAEALAGQIQELQAELHKKEADIFALERRHMQDKDLWTLEIHRLQSLHLKNQSPSGTVETPTCVSMVLTEDIKET